ncbi:Uncharacterised protein [Mycobacterium tuberculosis]|nr:Uncharacterised protein [Mycobacterium tuberculosis]
MSRNSCRRSGLPAVAYTSAPAARQIAIAACPTPPVAEWINTLSPVRMRARSLSPYQAVTDAVVTAAAWASVNPSGSVAARLASHVTKVPQQPLGDMPPTWSPTLWSVTSGPTAVTTPAKSVPGCGRCPSNEG